MNTTALAVAASVIFGGAASAADTPVKVRPVAPAPVYSWTGFYVGGNVGGAWSDWDSTDTAVCPPLPPNVVNYSPIFGGAISDINARFGSDRFRPSGFAGGVQAGYNWQFSSS